jgi:hypothetical protein
MHLKLKRIHWIRQKSNCGYTSIQAFKNFFKKSLMSLQKDEELFKKALEEF